MSLVRERVGILLRAALDQGAVTLLVAPPGFGKTIALRDTIRDRDRAVWLELDPASRLEDIVRQLVAAFAPQHVPALAELFDGSGNPRDPDHVFEWTAGRSRVFDGTVIVDDLHRCLGDPAAVAFLIRMMETTASHIRWIVASREVPPFPIGTWVARGLMALPVTGEELAFDRAEAAALADALGVAVDPAVVDAIVGDTEGWPMAVHLALQLWSRTQSFAPLRIRTREVLFAQIETEVWPGLDPPIRELLAACALLPEPDVEVLAAAGFDAPAEALERAHRLIPFVQRTLGGGYALHDLFEDFVRQTLRRDPAETAHLRERLARGLILRRRHADALRMLTAAEDADGVLELLADEGFRLIETGHRSTVAQALTFLGHRGRQNHPVTAALRGVQSWADGSTANAEALFTFAFERGLPQQMRVETGRRLSSVLFNQGEGARAVALLEPMIVDGSIPQRDRSELRSNLAAALATLGRRQEASAAIERVRSELPGADPEARARILQRLGFAAFYLGDLSDAASVSRDAAQLAGDLDMWTVAGMAYSVLYSVAALTESDSAVALTYARLVTSSGERAANLGVTAFGLRSEYGLYADRGDDQAFDHAELRLATVRDARNFRSSFTARYARALVETMRGATRKAISVIGTLHPRELTEPEKALRESLLALLLFLDDRRDESRKLLSTPLLIEVSDDFVSRWFVNLARAYRGIALWCHDRTGQARRSFVFDEGAVTERDRIVLGAVVEICSNPRTVVSPAGVAEPLERLRSFGLGGYARLFETILRQADPSVVLTPAELKTLRAFRHGGNTDDVAHALGKSPHTIEAQLKSAYRKIGCASRAEALIYARSRGWLDDRRTGIPESR